MTSCDQFLSSIGLEQYWDLLREEDICLDILKAMSDEDLKSVGIKSFGHRFKIKEGVKMFVQVDAEVDIGPPQEENQEVEETLEDETENEPDVEYSNAFWFDRELQSGRRTHHISVDFYRCDKNTIKNNGWAYLGLAY